MTKLVTGIEAIQSGKPWKFQFDTYWRSHVETIRELSSADLLKKEFIIKEEPREFWIDPESMTAFNLSHNEKPLDDNWIRVREVEK